MEGTEYNAPPARTHNVFRISWLAYVKTLIKFVVILLVIAAGTGLGCGAAKTPFELYLCIGLGCLISVVIIGFFTYRIMFLKSVQVYTDDIGVWLYKGILPWSRGTQGVKWRDLEDAVYYPNFVSWLFRSYTVRVGHRFTKSSEIVVADLSRGRDAVEHINGVHRDILQLLHRADVE